MSLFDKNLSEITKQDLTELIDNKISEDSSLEFKMTLASNKGNDPWIDGKNKVGKKALINLVKEIIGFANSNGGFLILGMKEKGEVKPKASKLNLIPRIQALSEKLKLQVRDYIEPTLNNIRFKEIEIENSSGVLVIRVEKSNLAPHRSLLEKECYIRRNDRSEKMTMREIKDLTVLRLKSEEEINQEFKKRKNEFRENIKIGKLPYRYNQDLNDKRIGLRFTFIPVSQNLSISNIYRSLNWDDFNKTLYLNYDDKRHEIAFPFSANKKHPVLRGVRFYGDILNVEALENGIIEITTVIDRTTHGKPILFIEWFLGPFYRGLKLCNYLKEISNSPNIEFAVEAEIYSTKSNFEVKFFKNKHYYNKIVEKKGIVFPRYSYADATEIEALINLLIEDFYNMSENSVDITASLA